MDGLLTNRRILVTGGAGFIGSALIWYLNRLGIDDIVVVDRLGKGEKWRHLVPLRFRDYLEADELESLVSERPTRLQDIGAVFHLGACSSTTETDASYLARNNFAYTKMLAEWALAGARRFVYASSGATYGARELDLREDLEPSELRPLNMYGYSKQLFDAYAARSGLLDRIVGLKYFNVYGPNEDHKGDMRSVIAKAFESIRHDGVVRLFKSYRPEFAHGEQTRDFIYVKDAVAMTLHLASATNARGLYNIGSGQGRTWRDLATAVFAALELAPRIEFVEMPATLQPKYQYATRATIERLLASGYDRPITSLEEGVADYVRGYLVPDRLLGEEPAPVEPGKVRRLRSVRHS
ncbi:MAG TPA: ADP-glyceromanno-heptose 6-epimerase [Stellaceae bacterium]|nr:ADP-glyceromanno-heptose 6-epimerase [Stellaceae bacterium]